MKKRILALFAACSMITTAAAGLVQTAYAAGEPNIRIEVADGDTDTQKVLTFFYDVADGVDGVNTIQGKLSFDNSGVTINSINVTIDTPSSDFIVNNNPSTGLISFTHAYGTSSADGSFAIVNITVPEGADDITASFALETFEDTEYDEHAGNIGTVTATIPKKAPAKVPAAVTAVEKQPQITGTGEYEVQTADIYGVEIKPNDESVSGAKVSVGGQQKDINFKTVCSGSGTVVFAVILASETGAELPELSADNVTPIVAVD